MIPNSGYLMETNVGSLQDIELFSTKEFELAVGRFSESVLSYVYRDNK